MAHQRAEARKGEGERSTDGCCDAATPASEKKAAWPQPDRICRRAAFADVATLLLVDRCRAAEECLDSFIDIAAGLSEIDPKRSTHNSEPTLPSAMNFDRDALDWSPLVWGEYSMVSEG